MNQKYQNLCVLLLLRACAACDSQVPEVARHGKNALTGELRKIFGLADAMRPGGPEVFSTTHFPYLELPCYVCVAFTLAVGDLDLKDQNR